MSWKDYQIENKRRISVMTVTKYVIFTAVCVTSVAYAFSFFPSGKGKIQEAKAQELLSFYDKDKVSPIANILQDLPFTSLQEGPETIKVFRDGQDWTLRLTFDSELQKFIYNKLRQYQVDWAGVSVLDAKTGAVKALVSYSSENPDIDHLSLRATFPAASIFKVITAGAAMQEKHMNPGTVLTYGGDTRYVQKRFLTGDKGRGMTLGDAFAHSTNGIFGKVGARYLNNNLLSTYASAFGFNETMPFEFPVQQSSFQDIERDLVDEARTAAGLGDVTLSPLHASLIAASVINDGVMMKPYSINRILDAEQKEYYLTKPEIWKTPLKKATASQMLKMMRMTINNGTARRGFRGYQQDSILSTLDLGGKTGSLTGKNPMGKNEWFVGYAKDKEESLAIGIVIVNKKFWKIKPSELAKTLIRHHFKSQRDAANSNLTVNQTAAHKKAAL